MIDSNWIKLNQAALRQALPDSWTNVQNLDFVRIGYQLKLLNVDWRSYEELARIMAKLEQLHFLIRDPRNRWLIKTTSHFSE